MGSWRWRIAASAYENVDWINRLVTYIGLVAKTKPKVKIFGTHVVPISKLSVH